MPRITALYRYPIKGFTPEIRESLTVREDGRIAGDRVLGFRFADSGLPERMWSRKHGFTVLVNTPGLARLKTSFDDAGQRLRITLDGSVLADDTLDQPGRNRIAAAIEEFVRTLETNPLRDHPERTPLQLIGDGLTPRYHDSELGQITLHSRESLAAVASASNDPAFTEVRFRSNIAIEGIDAWEELKWVGRALTIGSVQFDVVRSKIRCLATHANPTTGERDLPVMQTLVKTFVQEQPTFAIALTTRGRGGEIRVGDEVTLLQ